MLTRSRVSIARGVAGAEGKKSCAAFLDCATPLLSRRKMLSAPEFRTQRFFQFFAKAAPRAEQSQPHGNHRNSEPVGDFLRRKVHHVAQQASLPQLLPATAGSPPPAYVPFRGGGEALFGVVIGRGNSAAPEVSSDDPWGCCKDSILPSRRWRNTSIDVFPAMRASHAREKSSAFSSCLPENCSSRDHAFSNAS